MTRLEAGIGYRLDRGTMAKLVYQRTSVEYEGATERYDGPSLVAAQVSVAF